MRDPMCFEAVSEYDGIIVGWFFEHGALELKSPRIGVRKGVKMKLGMFFAVLPNEVGDAVVAHIVPECEKCSHYLLAFR